MEGIFIPLLLILFVGIPLAGLLLGLALLRRVKELERQVEWLKAGQRPTEVRSTPAEKMPAPTPLPAAPAPERDWEDLLGGSVLNRLGAIALVVAAAFFLNLSFERGWMAPFGPLALGFAEALGLVAWGRWLSGRGDRMFGQGLAGAGLAIAFATVHVSHGVHGAMNSWVALFALLAIALGGAALAVNMRSQAVAWIALIGGYVAPLLVESSGGLITMVLYVAALTVLALALGDRKGWRGLDAVAVLGAQVLWIAWLDEWLVEQRVSSLVLGLQASYLVFLFAPMLRRWMRGRILRDEDLALWAAAALALLMWTGWVFQKLDVAGHAWIAVQLAVIHLALALYVRQRPQEHERSEQALLALALLFIAVAIPLEYDGTAVTLLWTGQGIILAFLAARSGQNWLAWATLGAFAAAMGHVLFVDLDELTRIGGTGPQPRALLLLLTPLGAGVAAWIAHRHDVQLTGIGERSSGLARWRSIPAAMLAALVMAVELDEHPWGRPLPEMDPNDHSSEAREELMNAHRDRNRWSLTAISVAWALYGAAAIALGFWQRWRAARWFGVLLLLVVVGKGVLVDLSGLPTAYRVAVFLALGVLLMAASWLYSRRRQQVDTG